MSHPHPSSILNLIKVNSIIYSLQLSQSQITKTIIQTKLYQLGLEIGNYQITYQDADGDQISVEFQDDYQVAKIMLEDKMLIFNVRIGQLTEKLTQGLQFIKPKTNLPQTNQSNIKEQQAQLIQEKYKANQQHIVQEQIILDAAIQQFINQKQQLSENHQVSQQHANQSQKIYENDKVNEQLVIQLQKIQELQNDQKSTDAILSAAYAPLVEQMAQNITKPNIQAHHKSKLLQLPSENTQSRKQSSSSQQSQQIQIPTQNQPLIDESNEQISPKTLSQINKQLRQSAQSSVLTKIKPKKDKKKGSKEKDIKKKKDKVVREIKYQTTIEQKNQTEQCQKQWLTKQQIQQLIRCQVLKMIPQLSCQLKKLQPQQTKPHLNSSPYQSQEQLTCNSCQTTLITNFFINSQLGIKLCSTCESKDQSEQPLIKIRTKKHLNYRIWAQPIVNQIQEKESQNTVKFYNHLMKVSIQEIREKFTTRINQAREDNARKILERKQENKKQTRKPAKIQFLA